jgi:hypothetical protein
VLSVLLKGAGPLDRLWQMRRVRNVATLSKLDDLSLSMLLLDHRECCIREVQVAFDVRLKATSPTDHVHEAALIAIYVALKMV